MEQAQHDQHEHDGQGDEQEEDVHAAQPAACARRDSRAALATTASEISAMPSPASQAGSQPASATGTHSRL